ncbi:MAG: hypothetical protein A2W69_03860 [Gammaproteobacteria bacterium RIFCSPLOWO2_02_47_7]|nr:MAG: hypothetical protein A2W69_03860 [Gammaproteobacteria bacterium RIFCSPLOWO2_02_47_7]
MKKNILDRYSYTDDGKVIVDITADKIEYLYNDFDKHTPYIKKELDQGLVDYLLDCVREIGNEEFLVKFRFSESVDSELQSRVQTSIHNYFLYLKDLEFREMKQMLRTALILLLAGIAILTLSIWYNDNFTVQGSVINKVFSEGLTVAAWIALWESLATFLINWAPHQRRIRLFKRIAGAEVQFSDELLAGL